MRGKPDEIAGMLEAMARAGWTRDQVRAGFGRPKDAGGVRENSTHGPGKARCKALFEATQIKKHLRDHII